MIINFITAISGFLTFDIMVYISNVHVYGIACKPVLRHKQTKNTTIAPHLNFECLIIPNYLDIPFDVKTLEKLYFYYQTVSPISACDFR